MVENLFESWLSKSSTTAVSSVGAVSDDWNITSARASKAFRT